MPFIAAKCPQCGGELQLDNEKESAFCMHCGSKIIVQQAIKAVRIDNSHMVETWMKMGESAFDAGNLAEAYSYFTKVVEVEPNNWLAIFYKGRAAAFQSSIAKPRINELLQAINEASNIIIQQMQSNQDIISARNLFAATLVQLINAFSNLYDERINNVDTLYLDLHWDLMWKTRRWHETAIDYYKQAISFIDEFTDEKSISNVVEIKKKIVSECETVCGFKLYFRDFSNKYQEAFGYKVNEKRKFLDLYDQMIIEIRLHEPNYATSEYYYIDRLEPLRTNFPISYLETRRNKIKALEKQVDISRREKLAKLKEKKYWEDHPEEYQAHLIEIKREKERKEEQKKQLMIRIREKQVELDEVQKKNNEGINLLKLQRKNLGLFARSEKKNIDQKIEELAREYKDIEKDIDKLKLKLKEY